MNPDISVRNRPANQLDHCYVCLREAVYGRLSVINESISLQILITIQKRLERLTHKKERYKVVVNFLSIVLEEMQMDLASIYSIILDKMASIICSLAIAPAYNQAVSAPY